MPDQTALPQPLSGFLRIDCNAETYLLSEVVEARRRNVNPEYFERLAMQLKDPVLVESLSDPALLEKLTGYGFETRRGARMWLQRLYLHVFEDGPEPRVDDIG